MHDPCVAAHRSSGGVPRGRFRLGGDMLCWRPGCGGGCAAGILYQGRDWPCDFRWQVVIENLVVRRRSFYCLRATTWPAALAENGRGFPGLGRIFGTGFIGATNRGSGSATGCRSTRDRAESPSAAAKGDFTLGISTRTQCERRRRGHGHLGGIRPTALRTRQETAPAGARSRSACTTL